MERELVQATKNFTKKDFINSKNGIPMKDSTGDSFEIVSCAQISAHDENGELKKVSVMLSKDGTYYTGVSENIYDAIGDLIDIIDEEGPTMVFIGSNKSKSNRDFLYMNIL